MVLREDLFKLRVGVQKQTFAGKYWKIELARKDGASEPDTSTLKHN